LQDLEERVETDLVLALLHAREVGLSDADLFGELGLGQPASLAQLTDAGAHKVHLSRGRHRLMSERKGVRKCYCTINNVILLSSLDVRQQQSRGRQALSPQRDGRPGHAVPLRRLG